MGSASSNVKRSSNRSSLPGTAGGTWLWVELSGQVGFGVLAILGLRRSPWRVRARFSTVC